MCLDHMCTGLDPATLQRYVENMCGGLLVAEMHPVHDACTCDSEVWNLHDIMLACITGFVWKRCTHEC